MERFVVEKMQDNITEVIDKLEILRDSLANKGEELTTDDKSILRIVYAQTEAKRFLNDIKIGLLSGDSDYMGNAFYELEQMNKQLS